MTTYEHGEYPAMRLLYDHNADARPNLHSMLVVAIKEGQFIPGLYPIFSCVKYLAHPVQSVAFVEHTNVVLAQVAIFRQSEPCPQLRFELLIGCDFICESLEFVPFLEPVGLPSLCSESFVRGNVGLKNFFDQRLS